MNIKVNNGQDVIDSRDIIERIDELSYLDDEDPDEADPDELEELEILRELANDACASPDWQYGEALIRDSYFEEYAQDLAEDLESLDFDKWPMNHVDWEAAASELQSDYFIVDFDGVDYWIRG